ncbi:MAG: xanthine dehydrogenase family protein molybdopterin-binding subunit [Proteobacteria bacterium]|nr:xanthine dehydrogenase family protein molybdopterin-binding subunit [Pseudomonadota bacterium]
MQWIGKPVRRREDAALLRCKGTFTDDIRGQGEAHAAFVRSPHAHARILGIDTAAAKAMPGVLAIYTQADLAADSVKPLPSYTRDPRYAYPNRDGSPMAEPPLWPLAKDKVRHIGEALAVVIADSREAARDAAEAVTVDFESLPAVIDAREAAVEGAARVWDDAPGNLAFDHESGDAEATARAFSDAAQVTELDLLNNRVIVAFMEPRSAVAHWADGPDGRCRLRVPCQSTHRFRDTLSECLGIEKTRFHVVVGDVGGGFGPRGFLYPEILVTVWAARRLGRPLRWLGERSEGFLTDMQARDQRMRCALALDADGRMTGLRVESDFNIGAYIPARSIYALLAHMPPIITGAYAIPAAHLRLKGIFTNTVPVYALRGIGRAEVTHIVERLIEEAARAGGHDRLALRRSNLVTEAAMPYASAGGAVYDSDDFPANMAAALSLADWDGFSARRAESEARGLLRGIGLANYLENAGGAPSEFAEIRVEPEGMLHSFVGTQDSGQGHQTAFAQVIAEAFGLPMEAVDVTYGDSDLVRTGYGSSASRSMFKCGTALHVTALEVIEKGKAPASDLLEAAVADIEYGEGQYRVAGTDRTVDLFAVARAATDRGEPLAAHNDVKTEQTYPNGAQVAEVEIDPQTGAVRLVRHAMVKDVGRAVNPMILDGQLHGGIAQGIGQALTERTAYEPETGQLLSASFMDYAIPRADDLPALSTRILEVPSTANPLGIKGAGEGGATGAPPAVINAVLDALTPFGVTDIDMPMTSETIWRAIRAASG